MLGEAVTGSLRRGASPAPASRRSPRRRSAKPPRFFTAEYEIITEGERSPKWVQSHQIRLRLHLLPFFSDLPVSEIDGGAAQDYRVYRITGKKTGEGDVPSDPDAPPHKAPSRSTLHDEIGTLRLVLQAAYRKKWIAHVPNLSPPYKTQGKISHRPWFSPQEYKQLYTATRQYAHDLKGKLY